MRNHGKIWTEDDLEWLSSNYELDMKTLEEKLGRSKRTIQKRMRDLGFRRSNNASQIYQYNDDYFETIDTSSKAYWLGFISADGSVQEKISGSMRMRIVLASRDKGHLMKFNNELDGNLPIRHADVKLGDKVYGSSMIDVNSTKMCQDLIRLNIVPHKTLKLQMSPIDDKYFWDFMRGFIDGDGSFSCRKRKGRNGYRHALELVCASLDMLEHIRNTMKNDYGLHSNIYKTSNNRQWRLNISNRHDLARVIHLLYDNSTVYLNRKHEQTQDILNTLAVYYGDIVDYQEAKSVEA